jgi:Flp pilus assembly protein TadG
MSDLHRRIRSRGVTALEALVLLPVFLLLLLSILDMTRLLWTRSILSHAARETVRYATVHGSASDNPVNASDLRQRFLQSSYAIDPAALTLTITPNWDEDSSPGTRFRLVANYEFAFLWDVFAASSFSLTVYAQSDVGP